MKNIHSGSNSLWWGPPRKFNERQKNRKITWLELFYDLVYVIAISAITHAFKENLSLNGFLGYFYMFSLIFWGWFNGSLHHDMHGSTGLRTNLMTLWQMAIVAALVITLNGPSEKVLFDASIVVMVMQLFITYLWWSIGIYDIEHRKLNRPFTICLLLSFAFMLSSLFLQQPYVRIVFYISLFLNFYPFFLVNKSAKKSGNDLSMSESMAERMGSFTIIVFGEVVLGITNGVSALKELNFMVWIGFLLALIIVFALWWIFFSMVADKEIKKGMMYSNAIALIYIPTLMSLGILSVSFNEILANAEEIQVLKYYFGTSIAVYFGGIILLTLMLKYPEAYQPGKRNLQKLLLGSIGIVALITLASPRLSSFEFFLCFFVLLVFAIFMIQRYWLYLEMTRQSRLTVESHENA